LIHSSGFFPCSTSKRSIDSSSLEDRHQQSSYEHQECAFVSFVYTSNLWRSESRFTAANCDDDTKGTVVIAQVAQDDPSSQTNLSSMLSGSSGCGQTSVGDGRKGQSGWQTWLGVHKTCESSYNLLTLPAVFHW
jgi:hypothetical protein